jgi:hypothetical protein
MDEAPLNDLYVLDLDTMIWKEIKTSNDAPCARSFHCMAASAAGDTLYLFGGCGVSGRLSDVHRLNLETMTWEELIHSDKIKGRGGANFFSSLAHHRHGSEGLLYVIAGFIGAETNDVYSLNPFSNIDSGSDALIRQWQI